MGSSVAAATSRGRPSSDRSERGGRGPSPSSRACRHGRALSPWRGLRRGMGRARCRARRAVRGARGGSSVVAASSAPSTCCRAWRRSSGSPGAGATPSGRPSSGIPSAEARCRVRVSRAWRRFYGAEGGLEPRRAAPACRPCGAGGRRVPSRGSRWLCGRVRGGSRGGRPRARLSCCRGCGSRRPWGPAAEGGFAPQGSAAILRDGRCGRSCGAAAGCASRRLGSRRRRTALGRGGRRRLASRAPRVGGSVPLCGSRRLWGRRRRAASGRRDRRVRPSGRAPRVQLPGGFRVRRLWGRL